MVGEDHEHVALAQPLHDLAHEGVVVDVELLDRVLVRARLVPPRRRVALLDVAPEHVLDAVGGVEDAGDGPAPLPLEGGEEHLLALAVDVVGHLEEGAVVDDALVEGPGVLGQPQGREGPDPLGEVGRVVGRVGDGHRRVLGVEVERGHVERDVLPHLREHHPADGLHLDPGRRAEGEVDPVAQAAGHELDLDVPDAHPRPLPLGVGADLEGQGHRGAALEEGVLRPLDPARVAVAVLLQREAGPALLEALPRLPRGEEEEGPLRAEQVGRAHGGELRPVELVGREGDGHAQDGAPGVVLPEEAPEGLRAAGQPDARASGAGSASAPA